MIFNKSFKSTKYVDYQLISLLCCVGKALWFLKIESTILFLNQDCTLIIKVQSWFRSWYRLYWSLKCHSKISKWPSKRNSMLNLVRFSMEVGHSPLHLVNCHMTWNLAIFCIYWRYSPYLISKMPIIMRFLQMA